MPQLLTQDAASLPATPSAPQWGIYQSGAPVVVADSVVDVSYSKDFRISDYPVEGGGFQSYDKVELPYEAKIRFATGGSSEDRKALINSIEAIIGTTALYDFATPDKIYTSCNVTHQDYKRTSSNGVGLLVIDVYVEQVRVTATAQFSNVGGPPITNAKTPAGQSAVNQGSVQTQAATQQQQNGFYNPGLGGE